MQFPHNLRNIPRIVLVLLIIAAFGMSVAGFDKHTSEVCQVATKRTSEVKCDGKVAGVKIRNNEYIDKEIERALKVIAVRPDYAGAWMRLAVLYEEIGETEKADAARAAAQRLKPDQ